MDYRTDYSFWNSLPVECREPIRSYHLLIITPDDVTFDYDAIGRHAAELMRQYWMSPETAAERARDVALYQRSSWRTHIMQCRERIKASQRVAATDREIYEISDVPAQAAE